MNDVDLIQNVLIAVIAIYSLLLGGIVKALLAARRRGE